MTGEHVRLTDERGDERTRRLVVELVRCGELLDPALVDHGDAIGHHQRFLLVVRDVENRHAERLLQALDLELHLLAKLAVEGTEWLVHERQSGFEHHRPGEGDALLLPAAQLAREAVVVALELHEPERLVDPASGLRFRHAAHLQRKADVLGDAHVREQGIVLEHHADVALEGWKAGHLAIADDDRSARHLLEAGDHHQRRRLARTAGPEQRHELTGRDVEADVVDGDDVVVRLGEPVEAHRGAAPHHASPWRCGP